MTFNENISLVEALQQKVSHPRLQAPAPSDDVLAKAYQAAFRSPDHAYLRPWRFIECRGQERDQLGGLLVRALSSEKELSEPQIQKLANAPLRAPLVLICYAEQTDHEKVPAVEQILTTGCAVNNFALSLYAQGFGSVWRTGDPAHSPAVHQALGLNEHQTIVGYLYVGTPSGSDKSIPEVEQAIYVKTLSQHLKAE